MRGTRSEDGMERITVGSGSFSLDHDFGSPRDFELTGSMGVECSEATPLETVERGRPSFRASSEPFLDSEVLLLRDCLSPDSATALRRVRRFGVRRPALAGLWSRLGAFLGEGDREPGIHDCDFNLCEIDLENDPRLKTASSAGAVRGPAWSPSAFAFRRAAATVSSFGKAFAAELVELSSETVSESSRSSSASTFGTVPAGA